MKARTRPRASRHAGRTGVGLALAATTVAAMTVPAGATSLPSAGHAAGATSLPSAGHAAGATSLPTAGHATNLPSAGHVASSGANALALPAASTPAALPTSQSTATHRVRAGDTVSAVAARTGSSVSAIVAANNLNSRALITVGQVLRIPSGGQAATTPARNASTTHKVAAGDTVGALANRHGTTVAAIVAANELGSRALIIIGQRLTIPGSSASAGTSAPASAASSGTTSSSRSSASQTHTVRSGDTVSALANRYGTSASAIVSANGLRNAGLIYAGQRLTIPGGSGGSGGTVPVSNSSGGSSAGSSASQPHTVRAGDTVSVLAQRYGTSAAAIVSANGLNNAGLIRVGQRLTIPGSAAGASSSGGSGQLVGDTFLGRTYARDVVSAANTNKATLLSMNVPSRTQMQTMVRDTAVRMGVNPSLALAVAHQESHFDARGVSPANAVGVMQVIPSSGDWAADLVGRRLNLLDPQDNVTAGVAILRQLLRTADNFDQAVAGYYQGLAGVRRNGMYADTRNYVAGIKNLMRQY